MPLVEVDIGEGTFEVYADVDAANEYADGATHGATWRASTDDDAKGRALVTATRTLDRQQWLDAYNTPELRAEVPNIVNASIEMAFALMDGSDLQNQQSTAERIRSMQAGSVSITNFRGIDTPTRFPQIVQELLRGYLGSDSSLFYSKAVGTDGLTEFPVELGFSTGGL